MINFVISGGQYAESAPNVDANRRPFAVSLIFHQHDNVVGAEPQQRPEVRLRRSAGIVASAVSHASPTRPLIIRHKGSNP